MESNTLKTALDIPKDIISELDSEIDRSFNYTKLKKILNEFIESYSHRTDCDMEENIGLLIERYVYGKSLNQLSDKLGISQQGVTSRIENTIKAIKKFIRKNNYQKVIDDITNWL